MYPLLALLFAPACSGAGDDAPLDDTGSDTGEDDTGSPPPGGPSGLEDADATFSGPASSAAGSAVAGPGDLDGDGVDDVVVTAFYGNVACVWKGPVAPGAHTLDDADTCFTGEGVYDFAGYAAAGPGDVHRDGQADLLLSAGGNDDAGSDAGKVYLFSGGLPAGDVSFSTAATTFTGEAAGDYAGISLAGAGDVDGDGNADLLVGASGNDAGGGGAGRVYLLRGPFSAGTTSLADASASFTGTSLSAPALAHGASTGGDAMGDSVAGVGDVDGDGLDDLLLGASGADGAGEDAGEAWLMLGPVTAGDHVAADADARLVGPAVSAFAGGAVAGPGDLDGDGRADLAVTADGSGGGEVYVLLAPIPAGESSLTDTTRVLTGGEAELLGWSVAGAGDVDGDGRPDLLVGAPGNDSSASDAGGVYLVTDAATDGQRTIAQAGRFFAGEGASDAAGRAAASAGDLDGDGMGDILAGAIYNQDAGVFAGKAYLLLGVSLASD